MRTKLFIVSKNKRKQNKAFLQPKRLVIGNCLKIKKYLVVNGLRRDLGELVATPQGSYLVVSHRTLWRNQHVAILKGTG